MLVRMSERAAPPLNLPAGLASFTKPEGRAPLGMACLPSASIGTWTVAENPCPGVLILEPTAWSRRTEMTVSAGTIRGRGGVGREGVRVGAWADLPPAEGSYPR